MYAGQATSHYAISFISYNIYIQEGPIFREASTSFVAYEFYNMSEYFDFLNYYCIHAILTKYDYLGYQSNVIPKDSWVSMKYFDKTNFHETIHL